MLNRTIAATALLVFAFAAFAADAPLTRVESKQVCMINEHHMKTDQIPVEVEGKTYYGCCAMCKKALAEKPETRVATDPLSGKQVDKAVAVIAADAEGKVYYFENAKNLEKYNEKAAAKK